MRLFVTGATGYLGARLIDLIDPAVVVVPAARSLGLDITHRDVLLRAVRNAAPDAIIHAAAANPGAPEDAFDPINVGGSTNVAEAAAELGCRLVHVSTDVLHDGTNGPYTDDAVPTPIFSYGRTKAEAEEVVLRTVPDAVVVRTSLIYGLHAMDRGTEGFAERLRRGDTLKLFHDVLRQPVWVDALSRSLVLLAGELATVRGRLNVVGSQVLSREAFGLRMLDRWGIEHRGRTESISGAAIAGVPLDLRMTTDRAAALGLALPGVDEVLATA